MSCFTAWSGDWSLNLLVDKTAPDGESLVVEPGQRITLDGRWWTVSKAVVAPSGGGLVLTGAGDYPPGNFFIRDDQGNYLYKKYYGMVSRPISARLELCRLLWRAADMECPSLWCPMSGSTPVMNQAEITRSLALWTNCPLPTIPRRPVIL